MEKVNLPGTVGFFKKKNTNKNSATDSLNSSNSVEEDEQDKMEYTREVFMAEVKVLHLEENPNGHCEKNHEDKDDDASDKENCEDKADGGGGGDGSDDGGGGDGGDDGGGDDDGSADGVVGDGDGVKDCDSDEEEGWITPDNLMQACENMGGVHEEVAKGLAVACVTTDFAMQVFE